MSTKISATIVADSINTLGNRITSMLLVMPRFILAEFNTHRMFSRNSASSRAIPLARMLQAVIEDPLAPIAWMKEHKGMQGTEYITADNAYWAKETWLAARDYAVGQAKLLGDRYEVTKQICNRLLEPFMWHTVLVTATEWENFFALRAHAAAEIHMQALAFHMLDAMNKSVPKKLQTGEWHIPYGDNIDEARLHELVSCRRAL